MGIDGVPKPESIVTKPSTSTAPDTASTEEKTEASMADKVASVVADAAAAAKMVVLDTDNDGQEHNEL